MSQIVAKKGPSFGAFRSYLQSESTKLGLSAGLVMYLSYAVVSGDFDNLILIALSLFVGGFIPFYSRLSNKVDEKVAFRTALVTPGRFVRFLLQLAFNIFIFEVLIHGHILPADHMSGLGGILGMALYTTGCSQGIQYLAISLASRDVGNKNRNILIALTTNIVMSALAAFGFPVIRQIFIVLSIVFGCGFLVLGLLSDVRSRFYPRRGIGVFFGTFNPLHKTHLELLRRTLSERRLSKIYIHTTVIPKIHQDALRKGEIRIARYDAGMRVYEKTSKADVHVNYFPTGNRFYEYETRVLLARIAIEDAGLADQVEVLELPEVYTKQGFYGVLAKIRKLHAGVPIHGLHGSDLGGMWVRSIYDECGWIYPVNFQRIDKISATAIRNGARGMTTERVEQALDYLRAGHDGQFNIEGQSFAFERGIVKYG